MKIEREKRKTDVVGIDAGIGIFLGGAVIGPLRMCPQVGAQFTTPPIFGFIKTPTTPDDAIQ